MNSLYSNRQQKIYLDYSLKSDKELLDILQNKNNYFQEIIDVIIDILDERGILPEITSSERNMEYIDKQSNQELEIKYKKASDLLFTQGYSAEETIQILIDNGEDAKQAENIVNKLLLYASESNNKSTNNSLIYGLVLFFGGVLVTIITYSNAQGGGTYVIAWGAILIGAYRIFKAVTR